MLGIAEVPGPRAVEYKLVFVWTAIKLASCSGSEDGDTCWNCD